MNVLQAVPDWHADALCSQTDPDAFYPEKGQVPTKALIVCGNCPVQTQCLEWALANDERYGVWGGKTEPERRRMQRRAA